MRVRGRLRTAVVCAVVGVSAACGGEEPEAAPEAAPRAPAAAPAPAGGVPVLANLPAGVTQEMVAEGQQLFVGSGICYTCHGQAATGTPLAPNLTDDQWLWVTDDQEVYPQLVTLIRTGISQPKEHPAPMPAMGGAALSEAQVEAVAAYVYALSGG